MKILGLNKTTLLDYPGRVACTIFLGGCNFRCPFCHNKDIVLMSDAIDAYSQDEIFAFLRKRKGILTGVCITGGEPTINNDLPGFIADIKQLGYKIKLDTNGSSPAMLASLIDNKLIDCCAMDIKNAPEKYDTTVSFPALTDVKKSVELLLSQSCEEENGFSYEFRTTLVKELHDEADLLSICKWIAGANAYYLQPYVESPGVFQKEFHTHDMETLSHFEHLCQTHVPNTHLRGI